jgi:two-component system, OmpR family, KDP operon response regulator KdpE
VAAALIRVLVVEDDAALRETLIRALDASGFRTAHVADGIAASHALQREDPTDIVLLDIGLPFVNGWQILEHMSTRNRPGVIVISARGEEQDKVRALDLGADDYLAKPFGADELLARVRAVLRRIRGAGDARGVVENGDLRIDLAARAVTRAGSEVHLSPTEWALLAELARNAGVTLDHRTLLRRVWGSAYADERNYLRTFVQRLRLKLEEDPSQPRSIVTVGRRGYRFGAASGVRDDAPAATRSARVP